MARLRRPSVELSARLGDLAASDQLKGDVPPPIYDRAEELLEVLVAEARRRGLRPVARGDLLGAMIHEAPKDGKKLADKLQAYWDASVWRTLDTKKRQGLATLRPRRAGRPAR